MQAGGWDAACAVLPLRRLHRPLLDCVPSPATLHVTLVCDFHAGFNTCESLLMHTKKVGRHAGPTRNWR